MQSEIPVKGRKLFKINKSWKVKETEKKDENMMPKVKKENMKNLCAVGNSSRRKKTMENGGHIDNEI